MASDDGEPRRMGDELAPRLRKRRDESATFRLCHSVMRRRGHRAARLFDACGAVRRAGDAHVEVVGVGRSSTGLVHRARSAGQDVSTRSHRAPVCEQQVSQTVRDEDVLNADRTGDQGGDDGPVLFGVEPERRAGDRTAVVSKTDVIVRCNALVVRIEHEEGNVDVSAALVRSVAWNRPTTLGGEIADAELNVVLLPDRVSRSTQQSHQIGGSPSMRPPREASELFVIGAIETNAVNEPPRVDVTDRLARKGHVTKRFRNGLAACLGREAQRRSDDTADQAS